MGVVPGLLLGVSRRPLEEERRQKATLHELVPCVRRSGSTPENCSAAASTCGSGPTSPTVSRNTPSRPSRLPLKRPSRNPPMSPPGVT